MKIQQKKRIIQKYWVWISLSINCLIVSVFLLEKDNWFLSRGILLSVGIICSGHAKIQADIAKKDLSIDSLVKDCICMPIVTILPGFKVAEYLSSFAVLIALGMALVIELLVFLVITHWYTIRRYLSGRKQSCRRNL